SHFFFRTNRSSIIAKCTAAPPNATKPNRRNSRAISPSDPRSIRPFVASSIHRSTRLLYSFVLSFLFTMSITNNSQRLPSSFSWVKGLIAGVLFTIVAAALVVWLATGTGALHLLRSYLGGSL